MKDSDEVRRGKQQQIIADLDLDIIESHGSQEQELLSSKPKLESSISTLPPTREPKQKLLDLSDENVRQFVSQQLDKFDCRMEYDEEILNSSYGVRTPTEAHVVDYCKYVTIACKMESEIPVIALIYIERLLMTTGILINKYNWQRVLLVSLCLASKIWDDDSLENQHFPKVMPNVTNNEINKLEQAYLEFVDFKLIIRGAEYAKYYFIMRTLAEEITKESGEQLTEFESEKRNKKSSKEEWG
jgi:hypothetical protein